MQATDPDPVGLIIYVPTPQTRLVPIKQGSAIVTRGILESGFILCYYQEPQPNSLSMQSYACRLKHAAERLTENVPTHRTRGIEPENLLPVGTYDGRRGVVLTIDNPDALMQWTGETADQVIGRRLQPGPVSLEDIERVSSEPAAYFFAPRNWLRTQAGQLAWYDVPTRSAKVWDHDDRDVPELLRRAGFSENIVSRVTGRHQIVPRVTGRHQQAFRNQSSSVDAWPAQVNLPAVGQRIRLLSMPDDPVPLPADMIGIVTRVRPVPGGSWQVEVDWEDGPKNYFMGVIPMLVMPPDTWEAAPE